MKKFRWDLVGIAGGIAGVLLAVYAVLKAGGPNSVMIAVAMIVVFGGMGFFMNKYLWKPKFNARRLHQTGIPGKARILEVHDTNIAINNNPQLQLILELKNDLGEAYTTSCKTIVTRLRPIYFEPGQEVNVKIDPKNEKNVILDSN